MHKGVLCHACRRDEVGCGQVGWSEAGPKRGGTAGYGNSLPDAPANGFCLDLLVGFRC